MMRSVHVNTRIFTLDIAHYSVAVRGAAASIICSHPCFHPHLSTVHLPPRPPRLKELNTRASRLHCISNLHLLTVVQDRVEEDSIIVCSCKLASFCQRVPRLVRLDPTCGQVAAKSMLAEGCPAFGSTWAYRLKPGLLAANCYFCKTIG